jgi:cytochrome c peroxidase
LVVVLSGIGIGKLIAPAKGAPHLQSAADSETAAAFTKGGCGGCHTIPGVPNAVGLVGSNLTSIGLDGETRKSGMSAEDYIIESILDPAAFIAPQCPSGPCPENVMLPNLADKLSAGEVDLIIEHLLTLTGEGEFQTPEYELVPIEIIRPPETDIETFAEPPTIYEDALVLLGKYLFFDPRLSGDAGVSCATCHQPELAWTDEEALNQGYPGTGYFRNAQTVLNTAFRSYLYWDGRMDGEDMPTLVRDHLTEAHFMNSDGRLMVERVKQVPEYVQLFQDAYGRNPSFGGVLGAVTAYVQSLNSGMSPYDEFMNGDESALSEAALAGLELFEGKAGCINCHSGPTFSDDEFYVLEVPDNKEIWADPLRHISFRRFFRLFGVPNYRNLTSDPGLFALTKEDSDWGAFRTAPLREVAQTAPYMHNGAFVNLEEVVAFHDGGAEDDQPLELSVEEISQLVAFLESLSSDLPGVEPPELPEYQLRVVGDNQ